MEKVEVIIVGAGLAGLSTAMVLVKAGIEVLVVERGDYPGSKNVTGGRLYLGPVRQYLPDWWEEAPFERQVVKERLAIVAPESSITVELNSERFRQTPHPSYTILRSTFDRWFADRVSERGALIIPGYKVDDLVIEDGQVKGIVSAGDTIHADVVVAADGALSFLAEKAGLREKRPARNFALGVKEIIELPAQTIQERFGVGEGEGAAQLFFGSLTQGMLGGGYIYTNRESLSLGMVVGIHDLQEKEPALSPHELLEAFKTRPEVQPLIAGGDSVEYAAHVIPEGGFEALPARLVTDGMLLVGDAAGFALNMGVTVRGMDFAIASGALAGEAIRQARAKRDFSSETLSHYEKSLKDSFVWQDLETFRNMPNFLNNPRLFEHYPRAITDLFEGIMSVGAEPKERFMRTIFQSARQNFLQMEVVKDLFGLRKL